jgi:hypothetical protein
MFRAADRRKSSKSRDGTVAVFGPSYRGTVLVELGLHKTGSPTGGCPGLSEITDWTPFKMKHVLRERHGVVVSRELAGNPTAFDDLGKISFQHDLMRSAVLHVLGAPPVHRWNYGDSLPNH